MCAFLQQLRQQQGPDLHVWYHMGGLWFSYLDDAGSTRVAPYRQRLHLSYAIPDTWSGWDDATVIGSTDAIATAITMLLSSFRVHPPPAAWRNHMLEPYGMRPLRTVAAYQPVTVALQRVSQQSTESLHEYYAQLQQHPESVMQARAATMLRLLACLQTSTAVHPCWGTTDDATLLVTDAEHRTAGVQIIPGSHHTYTIRYALEPDRAPWPDAQIEGTTALPEEAIHMALVALARLARRVT